MTRRILDHDGEMARRIRAFDWGSTPVGALDTWPEPLRFTVDLALGSTFPTAVYWGPGLHLIYNDAWATIPADRHPWALGRAGAEVWHDIWDVVGPQFERVVATGQGFATYDQLLVMMRDGQPRETWWNYSFTPIRDQSGAVAGIINQGNEITGAVVAQRARQEQTRDLLELFEQAPGAFAVLNGPDHIVEIANVAFHDLVGTGRALIGRRIDDALPELMEQGLMKLLDQVHRSGQPYRGFSQPVHLNRRPGAPAEKRLLDYVFQPIRDAAGTTTRIFVQATDGTERATAVELLRQSEERLQLALESSSGLGIWDWDVVSDRVVAGGQFAKAYGVPSDAASRGVTIEQFLRAIHPDDVNRVQDAVRESLKTGERYSVEYRLRDQNGADRWVVARGQPSMNEAGQPVRFPGVIFDITERKLAEEAARESTAQLRRVSEAQAFVFGLTEQQRALDSPSAIMRITAAALGRRLGADRAGFYRAVDDRTLEFGPNWSNGALPPLTGRFTRDEMRHHLAERYEAGETVVLDDSAAHPGDYQLLLARGTRALIGVPLMRRGVWAATLFLNMAKPRAWSPEEVALTGVVAEIAWNAVERARAVTELRDSEEKFRAIANSIDQMVWSATPDGANDYFNERWYEFTGLPHGSTEGEAWSDVFHPDDRERALASWRHSLRTGEPYRIEHRLKQGDNGYRWVLGRAQPVRDQAGRIRRWFGTCTDIQEIVDAREVLARSRTELEALVEERSRQLITVEERLRHAQKMEAVGQLTGGIAHDFNNMLAVVIGALDLLERRLGDERPDLRRYLDAASDGAMRAAQLTQRLLAFSRQQPLTPVPLDANAMVEGMLDLLSRTIGEQVRMETVLAPALWGIEADPNQLENTLLNLCVNARDAMPGGGALVLETANVSLGRETADECEIEPGDYVQIAVSDTGSGMSPEVAAKAFDPFFTTKGVGKGTGLGLSQVFGFVHQSGGHVKLDTTLGQGTTVRLYLPRRQGAAATTMPAERAPRTFQRGSPDEVIMVVEDEERVRIFSVEALRELGYTVVHAASGAEALAMIEAGQGLSLLFTDVVMPEMTGPELADELRRRQSGVPVLFTSGYTGDSVPGDAAGEPVPILTKPFGVDQLAERVRALLDA